MKYRTVIEITCDAVDGDDALNIAGDYLKGDVDFGVKMESKTISVNKYKAIRSLRVSLLALLLVGVVSASPYLCTNIALHDSGSIRMPGTCTVMPQLKTQENESFRSDWETKKNEAVLDYIKN